MILCSRYVLKGENVYTIKKIAKEEYGIYKGKYGIYNAEEKYGNKVFTMQKRNMAFTMERSGGGKDRLGLLLPVTRSRHL